MPKIKVEKYLMKKGNRVGKAAIEFDEADGILTGFHLVGFTICDDKDKGLFVLFPAATVRNETDKSRPFFFLRPDNDDRLGILEDLIIDEYERMSNINQPVFKS